MDDVILPEGMGLTFDGLDVVNEGGESELDVDCLEYGCLGSWSGQSCTRDAGSLLVCGGLGNERLQPSSRGILTWYALHAR